MPFKIYARNFEQSNDEKWVNKKHIENNEKIRD